MSPQSPRAITSIWPLYSPPVGGIVRFAFNFRWSLSHNPPPSKITSDVGHCPVGSSFLNLHVCPCVVLSPYRYPALLLYNLLILRSAAQFGGDAWRNSDEPFRREMAAVVLPTGLPYMLHSITSILLLRSSILLQTGSSSTSSGASSTWRMIFIYRLVMFTFCVIYSVMSCVDLYWCSVISICINFRILCGFFFSHPSFPLHQPHVRGLGSIPSNSVSVFLVWVGPTVSPLSSYPIRSVFPLNFETFVPEQLYSPNPHRHYALTGLLDGFHIGFNPARVNLRPSHRPL